jgi:hypothetical protein
MQLAFKRGGRKAIDKVMKDQRAIFLKLLVLLVPREMRVEHTGGVKAMTDEQLEAGIEAITAMLEQRAGSVPGVPRWSPVGPAGFIKFLLRYWPNLVRRSKIPVMVREPTPPPAHLTLGAKGPQHGDVLCAPWTSSSCIAFAWLDERRHTLFRCFCLFSIQERR